MFIAVKNKCPITRIEERPNEILGKLLSNVKHDVGLFLLYFLNIFTINIKYVKLLITIELALALDRPRS